MYESRNHTSGKLSPLKFSRLNLTQTVSPVKSQHYNHLNSDKKTIINKLLYLFTFYSSKISKYSYRELNEKYFIKLIADVYQLKNNQQLPKNSLHQKEFSNIYFSKGKKHSAAGIKFQDFLQTLPVISIYLCPQINEREEAVKEVIHCMVALYEAKVAIALEGQVVEFDEPINEETKEMILKLIPAFNTVYRIYFGNEVSAKFNTEDPADESFEALLKMVKDFEIHPKLISAASLYLIYQSIIKAPHNNLLKETRYIKETITEKGELFTLSKFIELMLSCSRLAFSKLKNIENPEYDPAYQKEIFKTLLEYMQTIKSTKASFKASTVFKENRFSFILLQEYQDDEDSKLNKTFFLKDKVVKESQKSMEFFSIFDKMQL